jgi:3-hydroxybutyryl-CoA dehydrogenase
VGVVGAGTMGAGIAQLAVENGHEVVLHDVDDAAIARGRVRVRDGLTRRAAKLDLDGHSSEAWVSGRLERLRDARTIDAIGAESEVVFEAALEDLDLKQEIFRALDGATSPDVILATNTSALSVTAISSATRQPERVIGLHFFNPAPVMPLVEVVVPRAASEAIVDRALALIESWGKTPVRCADTPGFIVNRVNRPFTIEALRILEAGEATIDEIDTAMRDGGFPMGPFELMDFIGLDVNLAAAIAVWDGLGRPDRLRPSTLQRELVAAGDLGRKTGRGFYRHDETTHSPRLDVGGSPTSRVVSLAAATIVDRIRLAIDDEAALAVADGVATAADIDMALRLGAGHPDRTPFPPTIGT